MLGAIDLLAVSYLVELVVIHAIFIDGILLGIIAREIR
jgi:hypothetical protein